MYKEWVTEQKKKEINASMEDKLATLQNPDVLSQFRSSASEK